MFRCALRSLAVSAALIAACGRSDSGASGDDSIVIAMLPKLVNVDYFDACERGARKAAEELGVTLIYDGPRTASGAEQNKFIETWIRQRVDAIAIAPNQPQAVRKFVEKAKEQGIVVLTWDTDAPESGRDLMVNQVDDEVLGAMLMDELARQMGGDGKWAVVLASLEAKNLNTWLAHAKARAASAHPGLTLVATELTREDENYATEKVEALLNAHPDLEGILALDSNSLPGAAAAIVNAGRKGKVALVGNSTPRKMRKYLEEGVVDCFFLWDPLALGALTVRCAKALVEGRELGPGSEIPGVGPLTFSEDDPKMVILSAPIRFTGDTIDRYDFGI